MFHLRLTSRLLYIGSPIWFYLVSKLRLFILIDILNNFWTFLWIVKNMTERIITNYDAFDFFFTMDAILGIMQFKNFFHIFHRNPYYSKVSQHLLAQIYRILEILLRIISRILWKWIFGYVSRFGYVSCSNQSTLLDVSWETEIWMI